MTKHKIYSMSFASVYPLYVAKAEKKGRTKAEVDEIIRWLTGHSQKTLDKEIANKTSFEDFFAQAPGMNASRSLISGVICGVRVENIEEPVMRESHWIRRRSHSRRTKSGEATFVRASWEFRSERSKRKENSYRHLCPRCGASVISVRMKCGGWAHFEGGKGLERAKHSCLHIGEGLSRKRDENAPDLFEGPAT